MAVRRLTGILGGALGCPTTRRPLFANKEPARWSTLATLTLAGHGSSRQEVVAETVSKLCYDGHLNEAVQALGALVQSDCAISKSLFYTVLKGCAVKRNLVLGRRVHAFTVQMGYESDSFLCNHILRMYASHGMLQEAMNVFTVAAEPNAFLWSAIISAHVKHGQAKQAITLYHQMCRSSVNPDGHVFVAALQACTNEADLKTGQKVHADVLACGAEPDVFVNNCLVDMYAKCGGLEDAKALFEGLPRKDVVTWNAMLAGYSQHGRVHEALHLYAAMQQEGITAPTTVTFMCLLQACASLGSRALERGKQLHAQIRERGLQNDMSVANTLVNMYAKCGSLEDAQHVFDGLTQKTVVTWTTLVAGYAQQGMGQEALQLYRAMEEEGIVPSSSVTFVCLLQAFAAVGASALEMGKELHAQIVEQSFQIDVVVGNSLINMYAKCGSLEKAQRMFDGLGKKDVVAWNTMIAGYSQQGREEEALHLYSAMQKEGITAANCVTFACLLQACTSLGAPALEKGKRLHAQITDRGLEADMALGSGLVNMFAKCGSLQDAQRAFDSLPRKNVVTWTALIAGYSQQGMGQAALHLYHNMQQEGIAVPDSVTFVCLLQACASVAALHQGRELHVQISKQGLEGKASVALGLINMYAKCGSMSDAHQLFDGLPEKGIVTWNTLIAGHTRLGDSEAAFNLFHRMREHGIHPNGITFLSILTVCTHAGLVSKGREYFEAMGGQYCLVPRMEHYTCMVDLLGRAGHLNEALALLRTMPVAPDAAVWHTLLGACRLWSNVEVGLHAFNEAVRLDEKDTAAYVLMSNIYTGAQMWEQAQKMQGRRTGTGTRKEAGQSLWADLNGAVHSFVADNSAP